MIDLDPRKPCGRCGAPSAQPRPGPYRCADCIAAPGARSRAPRRRSRPRSVTLDRRKLQLLVGSEPSPSSLPALPRTRAECVDAPRPCLHLGCKYHLALEVAPTGSLRIVFPDVDPTEMPASCALDVADEGPHTLDQIAELTNVTRQRLQQIELGALRKLAKLAGRLR